MSFEKNKISYGENFKKSQNIDQILYWNPRKYIVTLPMQS